MTRSLIQTYNAISIANAIIVKVAARNDNNDEIRVTVMCVEKLKRRAMNDTAAATGRTARPRVHEGLMVVLELLGPSRVTEYP